MKKIAIIGAGLSGLMSAFLLKSNENVEITIFEEGFPFEERVGLDSPSLVSGVGGAGTVFGGKFCFPPASQKIWEKTYYSRERFEIFFNKYIVPFLETKIILSEWDKIPAFNIYRGIVKKNYQSLLISKRELNSFVEKIVNELLQMGVEIQTRCSVKHVRKRKSGYMLEYSYANIGLQEKAYFDYVLVATGRYSADNIDEQLKGLVAISYQRPDLGLRISMDLKSHEVFQKIGSDVKLKTHICGIDARTFCVCSGGDSATVSLKELNYYDGHFGGRITSTVNMGILARSPYIYGYDTIVLYCKLLQKYMGLDLSLKDYVAYAHKMVEQVGIFNDLADGLVSFILMMKRSGILNDNLDSYPVYLPSVDRLNPIIHTNSTFETKSQNLYVIGDASGESRGFIQAMWSAFCASENILEKISNQSIILKNFEEGQLIW